MSNKRILKYIIGVVIIIIILLISILVLNSYKKENESNTEWIDTTVNNDGIYPEAEELKYYNITKLNNSDDFATVYKYINNYINYSKEKNEEKINNLYDKQANKENTEIFENFEKFILDNVYYENESLTITRYYVFGINKEYINNKYNYTNIAFIVRCDYDNMAISIVPIINSTEDNIQELQEKYKYINESINVNEDSELIFEKMDEKELLDIYMDKYLYNCLNNSLKTFENLLDSNYKEVRFNNVQEFEEYVERKRTQLENSIVVTYEKAEDNQFIVEDDYGNQYVFIENGFLDYKVRLDNYTILENNFKNKYSKLNKESKVTTNVDMFIKMINSGDYQHAYNKLDETFRNNNFGSVDDFENYIKENFFENNYLNVNKIEQKGDYYVLNATLKSNISSVADSMEKNFVIKLNEGTDFVMSFEI